MEHRTVTIRMTGNSNLPTVTIERDNIPREYCMDNNAMRRFEILLASHLGPFYFDLENSKIEVYFPKG